MSSRAGAIGKTRHKRRTLTVHSVKDQSSEINVTPLIDVVLVLLIIFMVMTPLVERDLGVQLSTEKRTDKKSDVAPTQVLVAVDKAGAIKINQELVSRQEYVERLRKLLAGRKPEDQVVFVVASDDTSYAALVEAIDRAKQAGAQMVGLATDSTPP
jgi:biopolymer transport protein ExbD